MDMDCVANMAFPEMKRISLHSILQFLTKASWILFFLCLPVISFPFFPPAIGGGAIVRPLIIYPLIVLLVVATIPRLITGPIPRTILNLLPFIIAAAISSIISYRLNIAPTLGVSTTERILRAFITLGLGAAIYVTVALVPRSLEELRTSLRWMYVGFGLALLWGSFQAVYVIRFSSSYFQLLFEIQKYISIRKLFPSRISGPTYEPNWFAMQLSLLLVPWLLSAVLRGYSVFKWRWRRITVELILLLWSFLIIPLTFSRAGLIVLIGVAFIGFIVFRTSGSWMSSRRNTSSKLILYRFMEAGVVVVGVVGLTFLFGRNNEFFSRIWLYWSEFNNPTISGYFDYLGFGARFIYGETALRIFNSFPVFGVGLGNYAFFFNEMLPDQPLAIMPEVLRLVTPGVEQTQLITSKNLYFRLLAETGLIGLATFLAFVIAIMGCAIYLWLSPNKETKYFGVSGLLGLLAFALGASSFDSFAIPNMWVVFGLITAAMRLSKRQITVAEKF
jgi:hypothetical protein